MAKENPEWDDMEETASAALVPYGRPVPFKECPPGPILYGLGFVGWMGEHGGGRRWFGEPSCMGVGEMVQPLLIVMQSIPETPTMKTTGAFGGPD